MFRAPAKASLIALVLLTGGCGGDEVVRIASAPVPLATPTPTPSPTPTPTPTPPPVAEGFALKSEKPFVTYGLSEVDTLGSASSLSGSKDNEKFVATRPGSRDQKVDFSYNSATGEYSLALPDGLAGKLIPIGQQSTNWSAHRVSDGTHAEAYVSLPKPGSEWSPYSYSHFGYWEQTGADAGLTRTYGVFAYGSETPASGVPVTGTGTYNSSIIATSTADPFWVGGTAKLVFDFGKGTLSGWIHPVHQTNGWYPDYDYDYGQFDFVQTLYASGSARYSGKFAKDGTTLEGSFFEGSLTGPSVSETVARFVAPFVRNGQPGSISGVWVGKK